MPKSPDFSLSTDRFPAVIDGLQELQALVDAGDPRITIAVLDGPVDLEQPYLLGAQLTATPSLIANRSSESSAGEHGTHVTSLIFGRPGSGLHGVAPGCRGLVVPIFEDRAEGGVAPCSQLDLARAIQAAVDNGAHVINISGGQLDAGGEAHPLLAKTLKDCAEQGILVVAAAGNDGCRCLHVPAADPNVIVVGAMDEQGRPLQMSNWGDAYRHHGILAPGRGIWGAAATGELVRRSGTSSAAPLVTGVLALLLSLQLKQRGDTDPASVSRAVFESAIGCDLKPIADCDRLLVGRLNVPGATQLINQGDVTMSHETESQAQVETAVDIPLAADAIDAPAPGITASHAAESEVVDVVSSPPAPARRDVLALTPQPVAESAEILPSGCGCSGGDENSGPQLTYALGQIDFELGSEARRDSFVQQGLGNPDDPMALLKHLEDNPWSAASVTWVLTQESTPIYAIQPGGPYAAEGYKMLCKVLRSHFTDGVERVSIAGYSGGSFTLGSGQKVPVLYPELRAIYSWSTPDLVRAVLGAAPKKKEELEAYGGEAAEVSNFLDRVYYELRNLGLSPQDRAINHAATNAFQAAQIFTESLKDGLRLDHIGVERSPICRPDSDCWDVKLTFFHPTQRQDHARVVHRYTVDVSDVVPVTVGNVRRWHVH